MKKIPTLVLAGALTLSMAATALAAGPVLISAKPLSLTVNGVKVDTAGLPSAPGIPMRAFVEADGGSATWYAEENSSLFHIDGSSVMVEFGTGTVTVEGDMVFKGAVAVDGVTFVPVEAVEAMTGVTVTGSAGEYSITTPSSDPLVKLAKSIRDQAAKGAAMKVTAAELEEYYGIGSDIFEEVIGYSPMMINADTVIVGKVASGKMEEAKAALEERKAGVIASFEHYLPGPYEMAKNGKVVSNGDYVMLIISGDNDKAVELFNAYVKGL